MKRHWRKGLINVLLLIYLVLVGIDSLPIGWGRLKESTEVVLEKAGLWQGGWALFAPNPDKVNASLSAGVEYADGTFQPWHSPDWQELTPWQKMREFRHMEFYDDIRLDRYSDAWPSFARYLSRDLTSESGAAPVAVQLTRHWHEIQSPVTEEGVSLFFLPFGEPPAPGQFGYPFHLEEISAP